MADELTPGEKAYLESGGESADGLLSENAGTAKDTPANDTPVADAKAAPDKDAAIKDTPTKTDGKDAGKDAAAVPAKDAAVKTDTAAATSEDDEEAPADPKATVPYQKYARDRKKDKERAAKLEKELAETKEKFARGDERLRLLSEVMAPAQAQETADEDPEPDPNEDIIAWANWSRRELTRIREGVAQTQGVVRETAADTQMRESYQSDAAAFMRETPDFGPAYNHLITARAAMLQDQGYGEQEIRQIIHNEEKGLVERAVKAGKRPAAMIYAMAQQMGYRKAVPAADSKNGAADAAANGAEKSNGAAGKNGEAAKAASVTEEIERIANGQAASKSLSDGGGTASAELSIEALANMSERDFQAVYTKKRGEVDALLGKRAH